MGAFYVINEHSICDGCLIRVSAFADGFKYFHGHCFVSRFSVSLK